MTNSFFFNNFLVEHNLNTVEDVKPEQVYQIPKGESLLIYHFKTLIYG